LNGPSQQLEKMLKEINNLAKNFQDFQFKQDEEKRQLELKLKASEIECVELKLLQTFEASQSHKEKALNELKQKSEQIESDKHEQLLNQLAELLKRVQHLQFEREKEMKLLQDDVKETIHLSTLHDEQIKTTKLVENFQKEMRKITEHFKITNQNYIKQLGELKEENFKLTKQLRWKEKEQKHKKEEKNIQLIQKTNADCESKMQDKQTNLNATSEQQQIRTRKERIIQIKEQESDRKMFQQKEEETQTLTAKLRESEEELKRAKETVAKLEQEKRKKAERTYGRRFERFLRSSFSTNSELLTSDIDVWSASV
jgi:hypothetical protein